MFEPWFLELLQVISDIAVTITGLVVAAVAVLGLSQWQRELRGRARYEVIKRLTYSAFEFRDRYKQARAMWTDASEWASREPQPSEKKDETAHRNEYFARSRRLLPLQETLRNMYQAMWEGQVIFSDQPLDKLIAPFEDAFKNLYVSISMYFSRFVERSMKGTEPGPEDHQWLQDQRKVIYGYAEDELSKSIDVRVERFVAEMKTMAS